jgi:hypothetical protein
MGARIGSVVVVALLSTACLIKDTRQTWYLEPDGSVVWVVDEKDVRSDARAEPDREQEEAQYWLSVQQEWHPIANGLRELSGQKPRVTVLRARAPFHVRTEGRFANLEVLGQRLIAAIGGTGTSLMRAENGVTEWTLTVRDPSAAGTSVEPSEGVSELLGTLEHLTVFLIRGRFESAEGFVLSDDRRAASFDREHHQDDAPAVVLRLAWR